MTSKDNVRRGITTYLNKELAPKAPKAIGVAIAAFGPVIVESKMNQLFSTGLFAGTPFVSEDGVDVDQIYQALKPASAGKWPIELMGVQFYEHDLDYLYKCIKEAEQGAY